MATWRSDDGSDDEAVASFDENDRRHIEERDPTTAERRHARSNEPQENDDDDVGPRQNDATASSLSEVEDDGRRRKLPLVSAKPEVAILEPDGGSDPDMTTSPPSALSTSSSSSLWKPPLQPDDGEPSSLEPDRDLRKTESKDATAEVSRLMDRVTHLENEKVALNEELDRMRRADDNRTDDKKELETLHRRLRLLEDQVASLGAERESLAASLEELDAQHEAAIGQLLASREQLQKRCDELQDEGKRHRGGAGGGDRGHAERLLDRLVETLRHDPSAAADLPEDKLEVLADLVPHDRQGDGGDRIRELEAVLADRDRQMGALNDILRVYKENLEPDDREAERRWRREADELESRIAALQTERAEMMSLLDDKARENSNLKVEVHRLLDVVSSSSSAENTRVVQAEPNAESEEMTKEALKNMARLVRDREVEIVALEQKNATLLRVINESSSSALEGTGGGGGQAGALLVQAEEAKAELERLQQEREQLVAALNRKHAESVAYHDEIRRLDAVLELVRAENGRLSDSKTEADRELHQRRAESATLSEKMDACRRDLESLRGHNGQLRSQTEQLRTRVSTLGEANSMLSVTLQEREFELKALREKEDTLSRLVKNRDEVDRDDKMDIGRLLSESERMRETAQGFQAERDQAILALEHERREADELRRQVDGRRDREQRLVAELDRLRGHLLQVEESYTQEALTAEDREKELRLRLAQAEQRVPTTAHHQTESLQEQLRAVVEQRNEVLVSLSSVEDQLEQKTTALHTLRVVLERLQQERQRDLAALQARHDAQMAVERTKSEDLQRQIRALLERQKETSEALDAASRLTEQLDHKEDTIRRLRDEVARRNAEIEKTKQEIVRINSNSEVTVDRSIVKGLVVGLLTVPVGQRKEVLRVIATILDFNREEREKTGLDEEIKTGWMPGWLSPTKPRGRGKTSTTDQSLTEAFVRFLERESQPAATAAAVERPKPAASATAMARQKQMATAPRINPFNYPMTLDRSGSNKELPSMTTGAGTMSPLLLKPMSTVMPTFATTTSSSVSVVANTTTAAAVDNVAFLREALQRKQ